MTEKTKPDLAVSFPKDMPAVLRDALFADLGNHGRLTLHPRKDEPSAGIGWLLGSAFVLWIAKPFIDGFMQEAGKDAYSAFSQSLAQLTSRLLTKPVYEPVSEAKNKLGDIHKRSLGFSVLVELSDDITAKFLFRELLSEADYRAQIDEIPGAVGVLMQHLAEDESPKAMFGQMFLEYADAWQIIDAESEIGRGNQKPLS